MARLLTQHGCELPDLDLFQKAIGTQDGATATLPDGPAAHAAASDNLHGTSTDHGEPAARPPRHPASQLEQDMP